MKLKTILFSILLATLPFIGNAQKNTVVNNSSVEFAGKATQEALKLYDIENIQVLILDNESTSFTEKVSLPTGEYYIIGIEKGMTREQELEILSHEIIHVWQFESGDLETHEDSVTITYKGKNYDYRDVPYEDRKWEKDAYRLAVPLSRLLAQSL